MIHGYLKILESFLAIYGLSAVFFLGIFEEVFFFIPMSLLFIGAGFLIIDPYAKFFPALLSAVFEVSLPGTIGVVLGGLVIYWIVYFGGKPLIKKFGSSVGVDWEDVSDLTRKFKAGHIDEVVLVLLRVIPILPIGIVSIFCGLVRLGWQEFVWTTFIGTLIRFVGLSLLGWYLGREYVKYALRIAAVEKYLVLLFLFLILLLLIYFYGKHKRLERQK